jgi:hypothetical protein
MLLNRGVLLMDEENVQLDEKLGIISLKIVEAKQNSDIQRLEINMTDVELIKKDINMIVLPFFYFAGNKKYDLITYNFDDNKAKTMKVRAVSGDRVPGGFDYEVLQVLLKFREVIKKESPQKEIFSCTSWDIAKEMNLITKNKKGYLGLSKEKKDRISESISKLKSTNYILQNLYNVKEIKLDGQVLYSNKKLINMSILDSVVSDEDIFNSKNTFIIKFNELFLRSITNKYHYTYELSKLKNIKKTTAKRLFEVIDFRRKQKLEATFCYKEIALSIPLKSGRKNRILINGYLTHLKEFAYVIKDFKIDNPKGYFQVFFFKDSKIHKDDLGVYLDRVLPKTTKMKFLDNNVSLKKDALVDIILNQEELELIKIYTEIRKKQNKVKENTLAYQFMIEKKARENPKIIVGIKSFVEDYVNQKKILALAKEKEIKRQEDKEKQLYEQKQKNKTNHKILAKLKSLSKKEYDNFYQIAKIVIDQEFDDKTKASINTSNNFYNMLIELEMIELWRCRKIDDF